MSLIYCNITCSGDFDNHFSGLIWRMGDYVVGVLNPFLAKVFDLSGSEPGAELVSKTIDPAGGLSQLTASGWTRFEDGRVSLGITKNQQLFPAMELSSATGPSIGGISSLDADASWTYDDIAGTTKWRRGSDFVGIAGDGGFMIRALTGIMGDVTKFAGLERGTADGEVGTEDLDFVVDVILQRTSATGVSDVLSGADGVTRFLMDPVDGAGGGADGTINLFDVLLVVDRL